MRAARANRLVLCLSSRIVLPIPMSQSSNDAVRKYLAEIGAKGGKARSPKQEAVFAKAQSKGGKTVTPKKRASLEKARKILAARRAAAKESKADKAG